jgi:guanylate kinase
MSEESWARFINLPCNSLIDGGKIKRAQDSSDIVKDRMRKSIDEIMHWKEYDYVIVNRDFDKTPNEVKSIIVSQKLRRVRNNKLEKFVETLTDEFEDLKS